jgi:hypothetical protein
MHMFNEKFAGMQCRGGLILKWYALLCTLTMFGFLGIAINAAGASDMTIFGLEHTAIGNATLSANSGALIVSNLGTSGQDGVSIAMGSNPATSWTAQIADTGDAQQEGASMSFSAFGTLGDSPVNLLSTVTVTNPTFNDVLTTFDFSSVSQTGPLIVYYQLEHTLVATETVYSNSYTIHSFDTAIGYGTPSELEWDFGDEGKGNRSPQYTSNEPQGDGASRLDLWVVPPHPSKWEYLSVKSYSPHHILVGGEEYLVDQEVVFLEIQQPISLVSADLTMGGGGITDYTIMNESYILTPEPSTLVLFGVGVIGLLVYGWRRRKQAA